MSGRNQPKLVSNIRTPEIGWDLIVKNAFIEQVLPNSIVRTLSDAEMEQYRTPFANPADRKPLWQFPNQLSIEGEPAEIVKIVEQYHDWLLQTPLKMFFWATPEQSFCQKKQCGINSSYQCQNSSHWGWCALSSGG